MRHVEGRGSVLLLIWRDAVAALDPGRGEVVHEQPAAPGTTWRHGRFFEGRGHWRALHHDGSSLVFEPVFGTTGIVGPLYHDPNEGL